MTFASGAAASNASCAIRRATADDLTTLLQLVAEYCAADGHAFDPGVVRAGLEPLIASETYDRFGAIWMIDETDGYAAVTWGWSIEIGGPEAVLDELYVRTRGEGRGSRAIEVVERACRDAGMRRIFLETERANDAARRLYARHGFVADDSIWMSKELR